MREKMPKHCRKTQDFLEVQKALRAWYEKNGRDLPWRETRDPYRIWVSEIMLQQTQVESVLPYYKAFLSAFPTLQSLAKAPLGRVLRVWQGLGYYARARNLHRGAELVVKRWQGEVPQTGKELMQIPGIGRSTCGAILSLAFDKASPILDANVRRVICRLFGITGDPRTGDVEKELWSLSGRLTPARDVHTYTQAIMDLGAMVCTPRDPDCPSCPLKGGCLACLKGLQHKIPIRTESKAVPRRQHALGILRKRGRVLIVRRPESGLLGGLWGFPSYPREGRKSFPETLENGVHKDLGLRLEPAEKLGKVEHAYSHFKLTLHVFECGSVSEKTKGCNQTTCKWVFPSQLERYALSGADQKVMKKFSGGRGRGAVFSKRNPHH